MVVYHVTSLKKFNRYISIGKILKPVRAWVDEIEAARFSRQTGRKIILRLKFNKNDFVQLQGHKNKAVIMYKDYNLMNF